MTLGASSIFEGTVEVDYTHLMTVMATSIWGKKLGKFSYDFYMVNTSMSTGSLPLGLWEAKGWCIGAHDVPLRVDLWSLVCLRRLCLSVNLTSLFTTLSTICNL